MIGYISAHVNNGINQQLLHPVAVELSLAFDNHARMHVFRDVRRHVFSNSAFLNPISDGLYEELKK
jgi:hypothetical protein